MPNDSVALVPVVQTPGLVVHTEAESPPWLVCDLEVASVADVVTLLIGARRTGRLDVKDEKGVRSLFFESGEYTGSTSTHAADRLGEVLWRSGRLGQDQVLIAAEVVKTEGKMLGRALIELGFLEPPDLRKALIDQAIHVFEAACVEERGHAIFRADAFHKNPLRLGVGTRKIVDDAIVRAREHREILRKVGSLDREIDVTKPLPQEHLDENGLAMLQLLTSARGKKLTGSELIAKAGFDRVGGAKALLQLIEKGFIRLKDNAADEAIKVKRLCTAINLVMAALDEGGFGMGDHVREFVDSPPPSFEEALSGLTLAQPLDENAALEQAQFITGGHAAMMRALQAVLDDAMIQANDTLPPELTQKVGDRVKALLA